MNFKTWLENRFLGLAAEIEKSLPPLPTGHVRLWRGNRSGEVGTSLRFTNSLDGIALPFQQAYGGPLTYVDVPENQLDQFEQKGGVATGAEFLLPPELAHQAKIIKTDLLQWDNSQSLPKALPMGNGWTHI